MLKNKTIALYRSFELGYELRFQKDGLQYTLTIGNKHLKATFNPEKLITIANLMV
ncbi:MAG: hypothetical protein ACE3L7_02305 [Candidatus Pristimantibacillus sp.]